MAQHIPNGIENAAVINVNKTVPIIGVSIPPFVMPSLGMVEINSHESDEAPFDTISQIITKRKKQTISVVDNKVPHSITEVILFLNCMIFSKSVDKKLSY